MFSRFIKLSYSCKAIQLLQHRKSRQVSGALKQSKQAAVVFVASRVGHWNISLENAVLCG